MHKVFQGYQLAHLDLVGACNARCPWCDRGARNCGSLPSAIKSNAPVFMPPQMLEEILAHVCTQGILRPDAHLCLFNWGESLLHPQLDEILQVLEKSTSFHGTYEFSTNASRCVEFDLERTPRLRTLSFSLPGFSQTSYDRMHQFSFETVMKNILVMAKSVRALDKSQKTLYFHVYRHNVTEISLAAKFAEKLGFSFKFRPAFLNSLELFLQYYKGELDESLQKRAKEELFLAHYEDVLAVRPQNYVCPQFNALFISHDGHLQSCCLARLDRKDECQLGDIRNMGIKDIAKQRNTLSACLACTQYGIDYIDTYYEKVMSQTWLQIYSAS